MLVFVTHHLNNVALLVNLAILSFVLYVLGLGLKIFFNLCFHMWKHVYRNDIKMLFSFSKQESENELE